MEGAGITAGNVGNESYTGDVYADSNTDIMADTIGQNPYINKYFTLVTQGDFLLRGLHISSITGIVLALVFVLTLTLILEVLDHWLHIQQERQTYMPRTRNPTDADNRIQWLITCHRIATLVIGHVVLVCVMRRNIWILTMVVIGSGLGHFFLKPFVIRRLPNYANDRRGYLINMPKEMSYEMKLVHVTRVDDNDDETPNKDTNVRTKGTALWLSDSNNSDSG
ncbi:uncharacterized protein LOC127876506 [Dreissena polymorpha]|uniref:Copper transporter n=1 Tax=Dreissena polymorpha TaxID=45954 RepID=A0A9D4HB84_DREPO|nr:uncharacterized protein LOC127876506 [Dreissena polymorpha]KAH3831582.1 hypothetical protein DPMN_104852 [Dreissena polymorpha]